MGQPTSSRPTDPRAPGDGAQAGRGPAAGSRPRPVDAVGAADRRHGRPASPGVYRRRRLAVLVGLLLVVAVVVAVLALVWPGFARAGATAEPEPTVTVTADAPTPALEPVARTGTSAFATALPSTVLDLALRSDAATDEWTTAGALEAYELVYADGTGDDATSVTVLAGQWPTEAEAEVAAEALVGDAEPTAEGDVLVGEENVGRFVVVPGTGGTATVTWQNSTAVLRASGPADVVQDVYEAYSM